MQYKHLLLTASTEWNDVKTQEEKTQNKYSIINYHQQMAVLHINKWMSTWENTI